MSYMTSIECLDDGGWWCRSSARRQLDDNVAGDGDGDGDSDGDGDGDVDPPQDDNLMTCAEMRSSGELGSQEATSPFPPCFIFSYK